MKYLLFPLILLSACSSGPHFPSPESQETTANTATIPAVDAFKTDTIIPDVRLRSDASESFALFLPAGYSDTTRFPVIIFFDPHGDGTVPLKLYKDLANEFHYVLIGSNSSKNGMNFDETNTVANNLIHETRTRFSINENKITLCGFSGGAKVALLTGESNPKIRTIIYCGAAVPVKPDHHITLLGFAGTKDMNYTDVVLFERTLADTSISHFIVQWGGKHEFPTPDVFRDAFTFLTTGTIKDYDKKQPTITSEKMREEQNIKQQYITALQQQDLNWWKNEIASLNEKKKSDMMYERLLGFISLACYSISNNALQQNNLPVAEKILAIYAMADPTNEDCKKFTAELKQKEGKQ